MNETGKVGVARFVLRTAEVLAVIKPLKNVLVLCKIRFAEEIRDTDEFSLPSCSGVKQAELKMAVSLINQYSVKFNINKFKDEYSAKLLKVIKAKSKGKSMQLVKKDIKHTNTRDLMEQLKASLKKAS